MLVYVVYFWAWPPFALVFYVFDVISMSGFIYSLDCNDRGIEQQRCWMVFKFSWTHIYMYRASCSRKKREDEMVTARQF